MSYLQSITSSHRENLSGLLQIRIARAQDVTSFPRIIGGRLVGDIVFREGAGFIPWQIIQGTESAQASTISNEEGIAKDSQLPFTISGVDVEESMLARMEKDRFIVFYLDGNLKPVVMGTPDRPLQFRFSSNTGSLGSGRNEYTCNFYSNSANNKAEYSGTLADIDPKVVVQYGGPTGAIFATAGEGDTIDLDGDFWFQEVLFPIGATGVGKYATVNYYDPDGNPKTTQVELGKTIFIISEFSDEFDIA